MAAVNRHSTTSAVIETVVLPFRLPSNMNWHIRNLVSYPVALPTHFDDLQSF